MPAALHIKEVCVAMVLLFSLLLPLFVIVFMAVAVVLLACIDCSGSTELRYGV